MFRVFMISHEDLLFIRGREHCHHETTSGGLSGKYFELNGQLPGGWVVGNVRIMVRSRSVIRTYDLIQCAEDDGRGGVCQTIVLAEVAYIESR